MFSHPRAAEDNAGMAARPTRLTRSFRAAALPALLWWALHGSPAEQPPFEDATAASRIDFQHRASRTSRKYLIESMTGGVAMIDYDRDGLLDLYFVNGAELHDPMKAGAIPVKTGERYWNRLYRNEGHGAFRDVTESARVAGRGYGMGAAVGDFDNDGWPDLYVTAYGGNLLYRNRGDGTFEDVTARAGVGGAGWSSGAAWVDIDQDGRLDLVVARYLKWDFEPDLWCGGRQEGQRSYCHPDRFEPVTHLVYRNREDETFEDITARSGWSRSPGKGLGIAIGDYDRDGRVDIAVANDSAPQQLFHNLGEGRFEEVGLAAGMAYDDDGRNFAGMGIDFADYDNDGWPDLFLNALALQRYALFRNRKGVFDYVSGESRVSEITRLHSGWGARFLDYDNDGWQDLFIAQGHVMDNIAVTQPGLRYRESPLLMRNVAGRFAAVPSGVEAPWAARGAAFGDLDNDGWIDVAINCNDGPAVILRNRGGNGNHWLIVDAVGTRSNRDGIAAKVRVATEDGVEQHVTISAGGSYLSSNDRRAHFGLGAHRTAKLVEIIWPSGSKQTVENVKADQILKVVESK
jgi:hypothetical protein